MSTTTTTFPSSKARTDVRKQPPYNVILIDDEDHSYEYVIEMMQKLFGYPVERGSVIAQEVHTQGRATVVKTTREHTELKRDQIHAYGRDKFIKRCKEAMTAIIEPI